MSSYTKKLLLFSIVAVLLAYPVAWAASNLYNAAYAPAEWYQQSSAFFRSLSNPPQIIPVMASDGYRFPVDIGLSTVTIGSISVTTQPVFADGTGTTNLGLIDQSRRLIVNLGSETIGLLNYLASITKALQATPSFLIATGSFPAIQSVVGTETVTLSTNTVSVSNWPAIQSFVGTATVTVATGSSINIANWPASSTIGSGVVALATGSFPTIQAVVGTETVTLSTNTVSIASLTVGALIPANITVLTDQNVGLLNQAGGPFGIGYASAATLTWPSNAKGVSINSFNGVTLMTNGSQLKTGTIYIGIPIASGSYINWTGNSSTTPSLSFISNNGTNNTLITATWW